MKYRERGIEGMCGKYENGLVRFCFLSLLTECFPDEYFRVIKK